MIAGNDECVLINEHRYLGQANLFAEFNKIIGEKYGLTNYISVEFHEKEISLADFRDILEEVCERLYENMWNEVKRNLNMFDRPPDID